MKKRNAKKKEGLTWDKIVNTLKRPVLTLCFLIAIRTNPDNTNNGLLVALFALVMITHSTETSIPNSNASSHEEKTSLSIGGDNGISINREEKTTTQGKDGACQRDC